ncbi:hypothetical protein VKT23_010547 [Stygiomarasmius scandens]|uniref:F-box domain-containing protein n=1 Tax=Marasmiellus scandens TaxID=2682957 RepID=A0ABR1JC00_9AGAR
MSEDHNIETSPTLQVPIHRLPTELLSEIFILYQDIHCAEGEDEFRESIDQGSALTTGTLGSVCSRWRSISLDTPHLWSRFSLDIASSCHKTDLIQCRSRVLERLSRSKQLPLSFAVYCGDDEMDDPERQLECQSILGLLVEQAHRWYYVFWNLWRATQEFRALLNVNRDLPLLKTIKLQGSVHFDSLIGMFNQASCLRKLVLVEIELNRLNSRMDHLSHLHISGLVNCKGVVSSIKELADCFPALQTLDLEYQEAPINVLESGVKEIHFGKLENLRLKYITWYETVTIFSLLTLPSLRKISLVEIDNEWFHVEEFHSCDSIFASFISRSKCPLSTLELACLQEFPGMHIIGAMLKSMPSLTGLTMHESWSQSYNSHFTELFMKTLCVPNTSALGNGSQKDQLSDVSQSQYSEPILPNLQSLYLLVDTNRPEFDQFALVDMIKSRCTPDSHADNVQRSCLRNVKVAVDDRESQIGLELLQRLQLLKDAGIPIEI